MKKEGADFLCRLEGKKKKTPSPISKTALLRGNDEEELRFLLPWLPAKKRKTTPRMLKGYGREKRERARGAPVSSHRKKKKKGERIQHFRLLWGKKEGWGPRKQKH